jgi:hypothetical protein
MDTYALMRPDSVAGDGDPVGRLSLRVEGIAAREHA